MDHTAESFARFASIVLINRQPVEQNTSRRSIELRKFLRQIRGLAIELHTALHRSWTQDCHLLHSVGLFLKDRVDALSSLLLKETEHLTIQPIFRLSLASSSMRQDQMWFEAPCQITRELLDADQGPDNPNTYRSVVFVVSPAQTLGRQITNLTPVDDMCAFLRHVSRNQKQVGLLLSSGPKIASTSATDESLHFHENTDIFTLGALLEADQIQLPLPHRMKLALQLASNFLQLSQTS